MPHDSNILALYVAHRGQLVNYASKIVGDRAHAEDVVQEAFLRFDAAVEKRLPEHPLRYLQRVVRNLAVDTRRRITRERRRFLADPDTAAAAVPEDLPSAEAVVAAKDELRMMGDAMAELPERTCIALELHRFGGCTFKEIAAHLGISVGLAHALVIQGLEHCRERLCRK